MEAVEPQHWSKLGAGGNGGEERKISELSEQANCKRLAVRAELMSIKTGLFFGLCKVSCMAQ